MRRRARWEMLEDVPARLALSLVVLLAVACATPVAVRRVPAEHVHRELTANVLSTGRPSPDSMRVLTARGLRDLWKRDPPATLALMHELLGRRGDEGLVFALAELSFAHAEAGGGRPFYAASAVYAWAYLFPGSAGEPPHEADRRTRLAFDLYNRGLVEGLPPEGIESLPARGEIALPFGSVAVETEIADFVWAGRALRELRPSADLDVQGLANRYRQSGIGAPMSGVMEHRQSVETAPRDQWVAPNQRVPLTLVLRLENARRELPKGRLRGRLEAYYWIDARAIEIDGREIPLELELSSALAESLADSPFWDFELRGFFSGSFRLAAQETPDRLVMLHPWLPGRVPVVLVHGTASSPGRWADLVNEIANDPELAGSVQVWLFLYNTGNPILYSAGLLRRALGDVVARLDPEGRDPALHRMVVVGHSQGGLLARLQVTDAGTSLWNRTFDVPPGELHLDQEAREILERSMLFEPSPWVGRAVFVSTPHRGSYLAAFRLANLLASMVRLPANLAGLGVDLFTLDADRLRVRRMDRLPTSIDNMTPGHPLLEWLAETPPAAGVPCHSIIPVKGGPPPNDQSDGVVRYDSARLEGVVSEKVVFRSGHSVQGHPEAILEMKRILREHVAALP